MHACLLDKNVARKAVEGLARIRQGRPLLPTHIVCLMFLRGVTCHEVTAYILPQSFHVLERLIERAEVREFLRMVDVIQVGRYVRRWARRLREHGFTREDAIVLSLGAFGTDAKGSILGVDVVVTLDCPLIHNYEIHHETLECRLLAMARQLPPPFRHAGIPKLQEPTEVLTVLRGQHPAERRQALHELRAAYLTISEQEREAEIARAEEGLRGQINPDEAFPDEEEWPWWE